MLVLYEVLPHVIIDLVLKTVVRHDDLEQLVREVVLGALVIILDHGGADLRRRNRHDGADHPVRATPVVAEAHEVDVLVSNTPKESLDVLHLQVLALLRRLSSGAAGTLDRIPLGHDAGNPLAHIALRLPGAATIFALLSTTGDGAAEGEHRSPPLLPPPPGNLLV